MISDLVKDFRDLVRLGMSCSVLAKMGYRFIHTQLQSVDACDRLCLAAKNGMDLRIIEYLLGLGVEMNRFKIGDDVWIASDAEKSINYAMVCAAQSGHKEMVEYFVSRGANDFNWAMRYAAQNGHKEMVEYLISRGANAFNWAMSRAAKNGHKEIVEYLKNVSNQ